jgi:O-antigen ligase
MTGLLFGASAFLQPSVCFARPPKAFWMFAAYLCVYSIRGMFQDDFGALTFGVIVTLAQCIPMLWISFNVLRYGNIGRAFLITLVISNGLVAIISYFGFAMTTVESVHGTVRETAFEALDANTLGFLYSVGMLGCIGLVTIKGVSFHWRLLGLAVVLFFVIECARTGSRSATVCAGVGVAAYAVASSGVGGRIKALIVAGIMAVVLLTVVLGTGAVMERWNLAIERGGLGGREQLFAYTLDMFLTKPIFGWGPTTHLMELCNRTGRNDIVEDTHNDIMWALTATGLAGGCFFILGLWLCVKSAWKGRKGRLGPIPFALMMCLMVISSSVTTHKQKIFWIIAAFALASEAIVTDSQPPSRKHPLVRSSERNGR